LFSTNCKGRWFLTIKRVKSFKFLFCYTSFFLRGYFVAKKLNMELEETFDIFLGGYFSFSFKGYIYFLNLKNILGWYELTCFLNVIMPLDELSMINPFLTCVFGLIYIQYWIIVTNNTSHSLKSCCIRQRAICVKLVGTWEK
jgi:hypothetical protein